MNKNIASIANRIDDRCHVDRCKSGRCGVSLKGMPHPSDRLIVDMDCRELRIRNDRKRCDYLIFIDDPFDNRAGHILAISMEMKDEKVREVSSILEQIKGGIEIARTWIDENTSTQFVAVLVHNGIHRESSRKLAGSPIKISGVSHLDVISIRSGACLIDEIKNDLYSSKK